MVREAAEEEGLWKLEAAGAEGLKWRVVGREPSKAGRDQIKKNLDCCFQRELNA